MKAPARKRTGIGGEAECMCHPRSRRFVRYSYKLLTTVECVPNCGLVGCCPPEELWTGDGGVE